MNHNRKTSNSSPSANSPVDLPTKLRPMLKFARNAFNDGLDEGACESGH